MKIEQLIVQYLYSNKQVTLQDIGSFIISSDINIPTDNDKETVLPENAIEFKYNPKATEDEGLINYIVENTRKIKPLATSDLESFIILNKQFLNIGKPLIMAGLGTLQKTQAGEYSFVQAGSSHVMTGDLPKVVTEKIIDKVTFATPPKEKNTGINKMALIAIGIILLGLLGATAYYFLNKTKSSENENELVSTKKDSTVLQVSDTGNLKTTMDTTVTVAKIKTSAADSNSFYIVIKEYQDLAMAQKRLVKLTGYGNNLVLSTKDSVTYKMKMPFKLPITDTLRVRDSLNKFFQAKTYVELP
jgi:hypothetical protein